MSKCFSYQFKCQTVNKRPKANGGLTFIDLVFVKKCSKVNILLLNALRPCTFSKSRIDTIISNYSLFVDFSENAEQQFVTLCLTI